MDQHVYPVFEGEPQHTADVQCWCGPIIDYIADDGSVVWLHHRPQ